MKIILKRFYTFLFLSVLSIHVVCAQQTIQTPEQFLGYKLGEQFTTQNRILDYVHYLAAQSPKRMKVEEYGRTYENRPLVLAYITSEENLPRLNQIQDNNRRMAGLESGQVQGEQPAIVWLSYNVHGNESVSSESVMQVLYDLVNPANALSKKWLQNTVLIIDPMVNPDGRERYVQWYQQAANRGGNASPYAWEHYEPWPGGRPNHYYFDLNRDWAWQTQIESKKRLAVYNKWLPQVHADFHEMGVESPYYFSPAAKPFHESITSFQRQFQNTIGDYNRQYFDKNNWLYFTRENFDLFYPSYGDTWPTFNGAIGMTYEQGGSGRAGLAYATQTGDTLTLTDRIAHHHAASLATIQAASEKADQIKQEFIKYYRNNLNNPGGDYKTFIVKSNSRNAGNIEALTEYLKDQEIRFDYAGKAASVKGYNYSTGREETVKVEQADVVISMYQPKSTLVKVLFEPKSNLEDSLTYDITSWALPYAFGVQAYALKSRFGAGNASQQSNSVSKTIASTITIEKPYAYVATWNSLNDLKFLADVMETGIKVRQTEKAFTIDEDQYEPGTLIITRTGNERLGDKFDATVRKLALEHDVTLKATTTGFVTSGADFGSSSVRYLKMPKVAIMTGEGVSAYGFGEVWHYFEQQIGYPVTALHTSYFSNVPLHEFDVLILPAGSYGRVLTDQNLDKVKDWVRSGGKLIALESAAGFLAGKKDFNLKKKEGQAAGEEDKKAKKDPYENLKAYGNRERESLLEEVQGSVYRVDLDNTHPLAFGYGNSYFALVRSSDTFSFLEDGWNVGVLKKDNYATGFVGTTAKDKLQDALILGTQELGNGHIIYMADNPLFRAFWHSGKLMFGNAVFVVGQ